MLRAVNLHMETRLALLDEVDGGNALVFRREERPHASGCPARGDDCMLATVTACSPCVAMLAACLHPQASCASPLGLVCPTHVSPPLFAPQNPIALPACVQV
jgi:hypothetical protein